MTTYAIDWGDGTSIRIGADRVYAEQLLREASGPFLAKNPAPRVVEVPEPTTQEKSMTMQPTGIPTPAEFLASSEPDEEEYEHSADPLELLVDLERRVIALEAIVLEQPAPVEDRILRACTECEEMRSIAAVRTEQRDKIRDELLPAVESRAGAAEALIEEIEGIVKKSTSQVSRAVKAAIEAWRAPAAEPEPEGEPASVGAHTRTSTDSGPDFCRECSDAAGDWMQWPCPAQPVEEWRAYARGLGCTGPDVDTMNRSQIRTMLGIEQPVNLSSAGATEQAGA